MLKIAHSLRVARQFRTITTTTAAEITTAAPRPISYQQVKAEDVAAAGAAAQQPPAPATANSTIPPPPPAPPSSPNQGSGGGKKKNNSTFRQILRLTTLTALAGGVYFGYQLYSEIALPDQKPADPSKPRLIIVGSGWGSVGLLKTLDFDNYNVTIVSARNYFLFTPLLPSTATGMVEHRSIMEPTRQILRKKSTQATFVEGEVTSVDPFAKTITVQIHGNSHKGVDDAGLPQLEQVMNYDKLVLAIGSTTNTFGIKGVAEYGCYLKEIEDTQRIRKRIMDCIEAASMPGLDRDTRRRLMHCVVVGAGPTGVEFAGELHDFVYNDMRKFNPEIVKDFKVSLLDGMPHILPSGFNNQLVQYAMDTLEREQINIMTNTMVTGADAEHVYAKRTLPDGRKEQVELPYGLFVWAGGVGVRQLVKNLFKIIPEQEKQRRGLKVDEYLRVNGVDDMWAIGDCADAGLAPTAQVASQEGVYVGQLLDRMASLDAMYKQRDRLAAASVSPEEQRSLDRHIRRGAELPQFKYSHQGSLAYIGSDKAVADFYVLGKSFASGGTVTFFFWRSAYLSMCFSMRNKLLVALDWTKVLLFGRDISRE